MLLLIFLVLNAIFWGLFDHGSHCKAVSMFGMKSCPPHWVHLLMGLVFFLAAIYVQQKDYIVYLMSSKKNQ